MLAVQLCMLVSGKGLCQEGAKIRHVEATKKSGGDFVHGKDARLHNPRCRLEDTRSGLCVDQKKG